MSAMEWPVRVDAISVIAENSISDTIECTIWWWNWQTIKMYIFASKDGVAIHSKNMLCQFLIAISVSHPLSRDLVLNQN